MRSLPWKSKFESLLILLLVSLFNLSLWAQAPLPCGMIAQMEPYCSEACIICDIDGFTGINDSPVGGDAPDDFCTTQENNVQWIAFIAGSEDLTLEVTVGNCTGGSNSLEVGIYEGINCTNFKKVSNCDTDIPENTTETFTTFEPLVIGQYYFFVMDGSWGTICDYTINVIEGSTNVAQLAASEAFDVQVPICEEKPFLLQSYPQVGATIYEWTIDGALVSESQNLEYTIFSPGEYEVCFQESNACDAASPVCETISVEAETLITENMTLCVGDTIRFFDEIYTEPGTYEDIVVPGTLTCDTVFTLEVELTAPEVEEVSVVICNEDVFNLNGTIYDATGIYEQYLLTTANCDSTIVLNLNQIECNIFGETNPEALLCFGDANSGSLDFTIDVGTPPFNYVYEEVFDNSITGSGVINSLGELITINNLPKGQYVINVEDNFGNETVLQFTIEEPEQLQSFLNSDQDFNGYDISCIDENDGIVSLNAQGGNPSYSYFWSSGAEDETTVENLSAGEHTVTVVDENGCSSISSINLIAPDQLSFIAVENDPNCEGLSTGSIQLTSIEGGVEPYSVGIDQGLLSSQLEFSELIAGEYSIQVQDANGCLEEAILMLDPALIPEIELDSLIVVNLGDLVEMSPILDLEGIASYAWVFDNDLDCITCFDNEALPLFSTSYTFTAISEDGCEEEKTVLIRVLKNRDLFAPNIMNTSSANFENRYFMIYGSNQVLEVEELKIYDRWGNQVFVNRNFPAGVEEEGWKGMYKQRPAMEGVYSWIAHVVFLDNEVKQINGSFTLLR